jgi:DNA adenine methylase
MKPFLKWAGNKHQIVRHIRSILDTLPPGSRLIEPFVGSGAVFLNTRYPRYLLSDVNQDLIHLYQTLQSEGQNFIDYCRSFFVPENNTPDRFYELRVTFNTTQNKTLKAALFLYLNRHCYNGLCRYNAKNGFNVPFGRYSKPYFPEQEMWAFYEKSREAVFRSDLQPPCAWLNQAMLFTAILRMCPFRGRQILQATAKVGLTFNSRNNWPA